MIIWKEREREGKLIIENTGLQIITFGLVIKESTLQHDYIFALYVLSVNLTHKNHFGFISIVNFLQHSQKK